MATTQQNVWESIYNTFSKERRKFGTNTVHSNQVVAKKERKIRIKHRENSYGNKSNLVQM